MWEFSVVQNELEAESRMVEKSRCEDAPVDT